MEKLSLQISDHFDALLKSDRSDKILCISPQTFINNKIHQNEAFNFSALDFDNILILLNENEKLRNDFFKFSLYSSLNADNLIRFINKFECPFSSIGSLLKFILDSQNMVNFIL